MALVLVLVVLLAFHLPRPSDGETHADFVVGSDREGGGRLVALGAGETRIGLRQVVCVAGGCLWGASDPGFLALQEARSGAYPLRSGTRVRFELTSTQPEVSIRVGSTILRAPGETALSGTAPGLHLHPSWQLTLPEGTGGTYEISLRLIPEGGAYSPSLPLLLSLVAEVAPPPSATATMTSTPTPTSTLTPSHTASPSATSVPTLTPTPAEPTVTASATSSPTSPPSPTATATATWSPPTPPVCRGDCNQSVEVTVD